MLTGNLSVQDLQTTIGFLGSKNRDTFKNLNYFLIYILDKCTGSTAIATKPDHLNFKMKPLSKLT
ncbi:hypothetical protein [Acinetobacter sp. ANC 4639]